VITATPTYVLAANYSFYDANSAEDVFTIQMTTTDNSRTGTGGLASFHRPAAQGGRGDAPFSTDLVNAYLQEPGDRRLSLLSDSAVASDGPRRRFTLKYFDARTNADNTPIIRVTEMYLNRAEALAEKDGINQTSIDLINALRARAGLSNWTLTTFTTKQAFIDAITQSSCHMITTVRRKQDYEMVKDGNGKIKVEKSGLREITREGFEYELTINLELNSSHHAIASKDRTGLFTGKPSFLPSEETGELVRIWCEQGEELGNEWLKKVEGCNTQKELVELYHLHKADVDVNPMLQQLISNRRNIINGKTVTAA
jgi:hypothetical protein